MLHICNTTVSGTLQWHTPDDSTVHCCIETTGLHASECWEFSLSPLTSQP